MQNAQVTDRLDQTGDFSVVLPLTDPRTGVLALNQIWREYRETEGFVFAGIIESIKKIPDDRLEITGPTIGAELLYRNTMLNRSYNLKSLGAICADLLSGSGWSISPSESASNVVTWHCLSQGAPAWSVCACSVASFNSVGQPEVTGVSSAVNASWPHTVPNGSDRKLVVAVSVRADVDVTAVTFGGVALTQGPIAQNVGQNRVEFWYLDSPAVGTGSIVITGAGNETAGAISLANAATGALTDAVAATGFNVTPTVTQPALSATKVSLAAVCAHDETTVLDTVDHEELWNASQQGTTIGAAAISPTIYLMTVRFDGESVLKGIIEVVESQGLHVRERVTESAGVLTKMLERGAFGTHSNVTLMGGGPDSLLLTSAGIRLATELSIEDVSQELWNWIIPLGAGEGTAQLTLEHQTRVPNLITNPSFEDGLTAWTSVLGGTSTVAVDATRATHGRQSITMSRVAGDVEVWQEVNALPGQKFQIEGWTYNDSSAGGITRLTAEFRTSGGSVISTPMDAGVLFAGRWEALRSGEITAPATAAKLRIRLRVITSNGLAGWDNVRVWESATSVGQPNDVWTELTDPYSLLPTINWYISDAASITAHGTRQRPFVAKDTAPLDATKASLEAAADALYAEAAAQLVWWKETQTVYSLNAIELPPSVRAGDLVRLRWKGMARHFEQDFVYVDVDEDLWVLERKRHFSDDGSEVSGLSVSTMDRQQQTAQDVVIGKLENTSRIYRTHIQTSVVPLSAHVMEELDSTNHMNFDFFIPDNIVQLLRCKIRTKPRAIRSPINVASSGGGQTSGAGSSHTHPITGQATATESAHTHNITGKATNDGGSHTHRILDYEADGGSDTVRTFTDGNNVKLYLQANAGANLVTREAAANHTHPISGIATDAGSAHVHSITGQATASEATHTHSVSAHTHPLTFGIFEGTSATNMAIWINGVDRTVALTGAATFTGTRELDITNYLLDDDGVVVQGAHDIQLRSSQLGRIEAWVEGIALMAPFRVQ